MNQKSLTVCDDRGVSFTITSTEDRIQDFLNWIAEYNRGTYDETKNTVHCNSTLDMKACNLKSIRMDLRASQLTKKMVVEA